jgi:hypothetical protein
MATNMNKTQKILGLLWLAASALAAGAHQDQEDAFFNHVTFSGRVAVNVDVKFGPRLNLGGGGYNYLDGYVLPDSKTQPGEAFAFDPTGTYPFPGGITHYWGYDNSARQNDAANKEILMTALAGGGDPLAHSDCPGVLPGFELGYKRELGTRGRWHYGVEGAVNYLNIRLENRVDYTGRGTQSAFPYTFTGVASNSPPAVYQGTFDFNFGGPNFDISGFPNYTTNVLVNLLGNNDFEADVWGFRVGPYLSRPVGQHAHLNLVGGLALGLVTARAAWTETLTVGGVTDPTHSGSGSGSDLLVGFYVGGEFTWQLSKRWDLNASVQYQNLGTYQLAAGTRQAELDLSHSLYFSLGLTYNF